jgi:hypothetical protein
VAVAAMLFGLYVNRMTMAKIVFPLFVNFLVSAYLKTEGGPPNSDVFILNAFLNVQRLFKRGQD